MARVTGLVIAQEMLKLAVFLFHHRWKFSFDWEVMGVCEDTVHLPTSQKRLKHEYKDLNMVPKVKKADMAGMIEAIKEYLRSNHGVIIASLAHVITKVVIVQTYDDYPKYVTPDDEMIARKLDTPQDKNRLHNEQRTPLVKEHATE